MARIAARQHGVVAVAQLRSAGLSMASIQRSSEDGRLHRIHRGVYAVGYPPTSREAAWMAAVLACGSGDPGSAGRSSVLDAWQAAVSHRSAAELWGLLSQQGLHIDISVPGIGGKKPRVAVHVHRTRTLTETHVTSQLGIPVTTPERTFEDLHRSAATVGCPAALSGWELRRAERQAGVLGLRVPSAARADRTRSDLEQAFLDLCRRHRIPLPEVNVRVGPYLVDFLWRDRGLVVETDSYVYHRGRAAFYDDRERELGLRSRGFEVLRISDTLLDGESGRVAEVLAAEFAVKR